MSRVIIFQPEHRIDFSWGKHLLTLSDFPGKFDRPAIVSVSPIHVNKHEIHGLSGKQQDYLCINWNSDHIYQNMDQRNNVEKLNINIYIIKHITLEMKSIIIRYRSHTNFMLDEYDDKITKLMSMKSK